MDEIIRLLDATRAGALVQKGENEPVLMSWSLLHEAQQQEGNAGHVYGWLMGEYCRCEYEARQGRPWTSAPMTVRQIVTAERAKAAARAAEAAREQAESRERRDRREAERRAREERDAVEAERRATAPDDPYVPIVAAEIPAGVRFDVPGRNQGQIVEVAYGTFGRAEADDGDPYMAVTDRSVPAHDIGHTAYYRRR